MKTLVHSLIIAVITACLLALASVPSRLHVRVELYVVIIIVAVLVAIVLPRGNPAHVDVDHRLALRATAAKVENSLNSAGQINYGDNLSKDSFRQHYRKFSKQLDKWDRSVRDAGARRTALAKRVENELASQGISGPLLSHDMMPALLADIAVRRVTMRWKEMPFNFVISITDRGRLEIGGPGGTEVDLAELERAGISNERYQQIYEDTFQSVQEWTETETVANDSAILREVSEPLLAELKVIQTAASYPHARKCKLC